VKGVYDGHHRAVVAIDGNAILPFACSAGSALCPAEAPARVNELIEQHLCAGSKA